MSRNCDIVMKGGITSGVVYPAAVVEISKKFTFKNIGGTSAGAIAAALTAAAERRRARDGSNAGFDRLAQVPDWLAADNHLFNVFVPNSGTKALFRTVVGLFGRTSIRPAALAKAARLAWAFPIASVIGAIPGIAFLVTVIRTWTYTSWWLLLIGFLFALFTIVAGAGIAAVIALYLDVTKCLPKNFFGMVTGVDDANPANEVALSTWLANEMELTAGLDPSVAPRTPLTFGMLWDAKRDTTQPGLDKISDVPDVNLEMITTNVTWGRPYDFPVTTNVFFFDPDEMRCFFPGYVVDWMVARQRKPKPDEVERFKSYLPRLPLPIAADLPVIVATRMSLAFPILLSAVPLWVGDFSNLPPDGTPKLEHCWFSDGGISSNFPVTLFDSPLPRWPTFAINLAPFPPNHPRDPKDESKNVYMPESNSAARLMAFNRFTGLTGFLSAIGNAMQNWNDNTQTVLPGYRDRIVTVFLDSDEGGLNLDMPPDVLARLRARGVAAGTMIASHFEAPSVLGPDLGMNWENHRWLRLRSTMGALKDYLSHLAHGLNNPEPPDVTYDQLIEATTGLPTKHYPLPEADRTTVSHIADHLGATGTQMEATPSIDSALPKPSPRLVARSSLQS
ncbi:MAG TPA: hypothetical protein VHT05_08550 [Candidatus Elarobacter sp.]|nr:hypothetical protein [Candidatus Elarobacter sp.]